jgi:hypothetical protein
MDNALQQLVSDFGELSRTEISELLEDLEAYFEDRADARFEGEVYVANEAMRLLNRVQEQKEKFNSINSTRLSSPKTLTSHEHSGLPMLEEPLITEEEFQDFINTHDE